MAVNSISPTQPVQQAQAVKKSEGTESRKQADIQEANRVQSRKESDQHQARIRQAQLGKTQEPSKPSVNTSGQKVGTLIDISA
jgi:hypothetical protein